MAWHTDFDVGGPPRIVACSVPILLKIAILEAYSSSVHFLGEMVVVYTCRVERKLNTDLGSPEMVKG